MIPWRGFDTPASSPPTEQNERDNSICINRSVEAFSNIICRRHSRYNENSTERSSHPLHSCDNAAQSNPEDFAW